ncbi:MAG: Nif3-like dinuclear metal center hexameric protein [Chitinophagaceae bacterium]|jgi:dinuclear metal center YbgI/SA1388 family protein|nr:Nif3-like dinuclear metal center hexameric protein [Chitinophagaceae bacterium]
MPSIKEILNALETWAPPAYQESYDNSGLITGQPNWECTGVLCSLDATEEVVLEARARRCNLVVAHHPIVFSSLKKLSGQGYVERAVVRAIKEDIAIYAIHTNLDNVQDGVNRLMALQLGLRPESLAVLAPKTGLLQKLYTYVPLEQAGPVREALYAAGAGHIGKYAECSFSTEGNGSFRPLEGSNPTIGSSGGARETVREEKVEVILPAHKSRAVLAALFAAHPYETVAYELVSLQNPMQETGSGMIGELPAALTETAFLAQLKERFGLTVIRHTPMLNRPVRTVALCGGAGSFLTRAAIAAGADAYVTADVKYHEFFDADGQLLLADIGHFESEQYTIDGISAYLRHKFPTFAVLQTEVHTNPVRYFV